MAYKLVAVYLILVLVLNQGFQDIQNPLFQPRPSTNQYYDPGNSNNNGGNPGGGTGPSGNNNNGGGNSGGNNGGSGNPNTGGGSGNFNGGGNNNGNNGGGSFGGNNNNNNGPNLKPYCPECFDDWFARYSSRYGFTSDELPYRRNIFTQNYNKIIAHNRLTNVTYKKGLNQFTGLTQQQFERISFGQQPGQPNSTVLQESFPAFTPPNRLGIPSFPNNNGNQIPGGQPGQTPQGSQHSGPIPKDWVPPPGQGIVTPPSGFLPPTNPVRLLQQTNFFNFLGWDWRGVKGALSPVKDQGRCGSCYAFAATGAAESAIMISRGYWNVQLSEQQIIDCSKVGNLGCEGGFKDRSLNYIKSYGLVASEAYPYEQKLNHNFCKYSSGDFKIKRVQYINGCANFRRAVRKAPVAVSVSAGAQWEFYHSGIMQCPEGAKVAHAGLLVGYTPQLHWIFKNSWGAHWGENGYITIDVFSNCGICVKVGVQAFM